MADFHTDIQSIKFLVNTSDSKEDALSRFDGMFGFSIDFATAQKVLHDSLDKKFPFKLETKASFVSRINAKLKE